MSDYQDITGTRIKYLSSDPTLQSSLEGQVWYNSTTGVNKALIKFGSFRAGGNANSARGQNFGSGTSTAAIQAGGLSPGTTHNSSEEYNGFTWTEGNNLNTARRVAAANGPQTAAFAAGGFTPPNTNAAESYNGTSWSNMPNIGTARRVAAGAGTSTAAAIFGGYVTAAVANTEEYSGSSWTSSGSMNSARFGLAGSGTQTAAFAFGGTNPSTMILVTENYDGTSWATSDSLGAGRYSTAGSTAGTQTASLMFGGLTKPGGALQTLAQNYDGSAWTAAGNLSEGRGYLGGAGTSTNAIACWGGNSPFLSSTEEYNFSTSVLTSAVWASGGSASNSARTRALAGTQTAAFMSGGYVGANNQTRDTEHYDGSSWTSGGDLVAQGNNPPGGTYGGSAVGTQTAGLFAGGSSQGSTDYYFNTSYEYDGSSWSSPATFTSPGLAYLNMFGTQTAAVSGGGVRPGQPYVRNYEYDGSSWSSGEDLPVGRAAGGSAGTLTAGIIFGGYNPGVSPPALTTSKHYDGTNWTAGGDMNFGSNGGGSNGTQTAALAIRGDNGSGDVASCQQYDGSTWTITATAATVVSGLRNGAGTTSAALSAGGSPSAVEEFTGATDTETAVTLTTS